MENRIYPGKLLLFGEYTVLTGSRALAIPIQQWSGVWKYGKGVDPRLGGLINHMEQSQFADSLELGALKQDLSKGMYFESSIPQGYGLGSSAALTAAIFNDYRRDRAGLSISDTVKELASIESYYHGHSSGLDPLVSFLGKSVLHENGGYSTVQINPREDFPQIFLINSGIGRFTAPLVARFKSLLEDPDYINEVINPLNMNVDHVIEYFLSGSWELFWQCLDLISEVQFTRFKEMLPEPVEVIWRRVADRKDMRLKLCGAGGGGYFLGFAQPGVDVEMELGCAVDIIEI